MKLLIKYSTRKSGLAKIMMSPIVVAANQYLRSQAGLTIIELVAIVLILAIFTAVALPRFLDVTEDASNTSICAVLDRSNTVNIDRSGIYEEMLSLRTFHPKPKSHGS